jgi:hypothetical protein
MPVPIKYFKDSNQAWESLRLLSNHSIKTYIREREAKRGGDDDRVTTVYDLVVLRDDETDDARKILSFEFGQTWGENVT